MTQRLRQVCQEPFRIFFPAGALLGFAGVSLWLLYYFGAGIPYPNVAHARLMIEGLMASFIFGFLGTAGPRLTSAPHFSIGEVAILFTLDLLAAGSGNPRRSRTRRPARAFADTALVLHHHERAPHPRHDLTRNG